MENANHIAITDSNAESAKHDKFTRRGFLGIGSAALAVAGIAPAMAADRSRSDPGPGNPALDAQNQDSMWPPSTDSKSLVPTFKYPFALANKRVYEGGWSREVTVRELPVSKSMAGVNMRLTAGGVRELHWHTAGEWAIMLYGTARITAVNADGKSFVADVKKNDLWYFPSGIPHSIQGLGPDGAEFMLVFDDGDFSEAETVLLSDSMAHLPREVLAKNFGIAEDAFKNLPQQELFIFQAEVPGPLEADQKAAAGSMDASPQDFAFRTMDFPVTKRTKVGEVRIVDSSAFKVSTTVAMAMVTVRPGGLRELGSASGSGPAGGWERGASHGGGRLVGAGAIIMITITSASIISIFITTGARHRSRGAQLWVQRLERPGVVPQLEQPLQPVLWPCR